MLLKLMTYQPNHSEDEPAYQELQISQLCPGIITIAVGYEIEEGGPRYEIDLDESKVMALIKLLKVASDYSKD